MGLYLWRVIEKGMLQAKEDEASSQHHILARQQKIGKLRKHYCTECKEVWTEFGWIEYALIKGRGPTILLLHGAISFLFFFFFDFCVQLTQHF
jgi:hypothetical protein